MACVLRRCAVLIACGLLTLSPARAKSWNIPAPELPARAFVLIETQSGAELATFNADRRLPPASLTKLMTAYLLFGDLRAGKLKLEERASVSRYAARLPGARMFLREGEQVPVQELFKGMLVQSGNDATFALIEHVNHTLPVFVARMNAMAAELGLANTHFRQRHGPQQPATLFERTRPDTRRRRAQARFPRIRQLVRAQGIQLGRYRAAEPQSVAARYRCGRTQNRPHRERRLLSGGQRGTRRHAPYCHRAGHGQRTRTRAQRAAAAQLRF